MSLPALDIAVFHAVNGLGFAPLDALFVTVSMPQFGLATAGLIAAYFAWRKRWDAVWIILAGIVAVALCDLVGARVLKPLFARARPCFALPPETVRLLVPISASSGSMPSLHAANNAAAALVAFLGQRRTGWVLFPLAMLVALSRVGLGVHYPSDLLAGFLWGALCAIAGWGVALLAQKGWRKLRPGTGSAAAAGSTSGPPAGS
ncbi:MAG: phosphatase PAP2 family protein [Deltaproteobacteria bacterium]|nr:phosphatase PAP2 family protein [Deltaproteobacteria bacterium]